MKKLALYSFSLLAFAQSAVAAAPAQYDGNWMVRARAVAVLPQETSSMNIADKVKVDNSYVPEVDVSYFFTPNIAAELIAAVSKHNVSTNGGVDAGSTWVLPPTLTVQYHFTQLSSMKPYVGAGVNYTHFFSSKGGSLSHVSYEDSVGPAVQAGVDVPMGNSWYFNADVKKVWMSTTAKFSPSGVRANVDLDPVLVGLGVGYRF